MKNVRPCPYCGGEVEVVRVADFKGQKAYRIQCKRCYKLVARGQKFECETDAEGKERIAQYNEYMENQFSRPIYVNQSGIASKRDYYAKSNPGYGAEYYDSEDYD